MNQEGCEKDIFLTVITVCKNNLDGLKTTWATIRNQTRKLEWIVVDGDSTDGTKLFLQTIQGENIQVVSEPDQGLYDAMNKGVRMSSGEYLIFINSGDRLAHAEVAERVATEISKHQYPDMLYGDSLELTENDRLLKKKARSHTKIWYGMFTHHQAIVYKRAVIRGLAYRLEYRIGADYAFTSEFLMNSRGKAVYLAEPICIFEQGGISGRNPKVGEQDQWNIRKTIFKMPAYQRAAIRFVHWIAFQCKTKFPNLYKKVRYLYGESYSGFRNHYDQK